MKVLCRSRKRSDLTIDRCRRYAQEMAGELNIGTSYTVYAQALRRGCLTYLIAPRGSDGLARPWWYPAEWFVLRDGSVSRLWVFSYTTHEEAGGELAIWGYPEIANSYEHWLGLQDRDEAEMLVFFRRKAEMDLEEDGSGAAVGDMG